MESRPTLRGRDLNKNFETETLSKNPRPRLEIQDWKSRLKFMDYAGIF